MAYCADTSTGTVILTASQPASASCNAVVFTGGEYANLVQQTEPFDATTAAAYWSFALVTVLACWWIAKSAGILIQFMKRH